MNQPEPKQTPQKPEDLGDQINEAGQPDIIIHQVIEPEQEPNNIPLASLDQQHQSNFIFFFIQFLRDKEDIDAQEKNQDQEDKASPDKDDDQNEGSDEEGDEDQKDGQDGGIQKQSSDSNRQDNDTSQLQTIGGKKCFNKLCNSKKIFKKIRSKVEISRYRFLCKNCYDNYVNNSFCQFCEQIYSNYQNEEDDTKWVGCDKCQRWNHIQCERKYRHKNFEINKDKDTQYECLSCSKKNRNGQIAVQQPAVEQNKRKVVERDYEGTRVYRTKLQINKEERIPIFHKKPDIFPCLESFLQTYNFRLWLNDANIREDIDALRSLNRRPPTEEEVKKNKKVKLDY